MSSPAPSDRDESQCVYELEAIYANVPAGMALVDSQFRFVRVNQRMAEINGLPVSEHLGRTLAEVLPNLWPRLEPIYREVIDHGRPVHDVEVSGFRASYDPVYGREGRFIGVSVFVSDVTEARRNEAAMRRQLAEIEAIYASAPVGLCVFDENLRWTRVNHRLAEINGASVEDHIGKTPAALLPDFAAAAEEALRKVIETGESLLDFELSGRVPQDSGEIRYWNNRWVPLKDEQGRVVGVSVALEETTKRRKAEEALRESERLYRAIGESIDYGVWVCAPDGRNTYASESFLKLTGLTQERCSNFGWVEVLHPDEAESTAAAWQECVRTEGRWDLEHRVRGVDGEWHPILARGAPVRSADGRIVCWAGINLDIGARQRTEAELEALMDAVPAAVFIAQDAECRTMLGNRTAYALLRVPFGTNVSSSQRFDTPKTWRETKDGRDLAPDELPMQVAASSGQAVHDFEFEIAFGDGSSVCCLTFAVPLLDESGRPRGAIGVIVDITERKRSEKLLRETQKLESIGLLAGGVAHDFNNILVGVIGNASLAREMVSETHPAADLLDGVIQSGERAAHLTRQMLAYSGKGQFVIEVLNVSTLIEQMEGLVRPSIPKKTVLHLDLKPGLPSIKADRGQIQQVFMNVVLNAAEAIGTAPGVITVRTGVVDRRGRSAGPEPDVGHLSPDQYVYLEIRDTGEGMDAATRSRIFDPFYSTRFTGRGLGLAAVAGIVRGHKGAIQVESLPGAGSCFTIFFPVSGGAAKNDGARQAPAVRARRLVLVVDDEESVRDVARRSLEMRGFEAVAAETGMAAVELYRRHPGEFVAVVLDLSMPGMSGQETLPELRKIRPDVPIIVSSGYSEAQAMRLFQGQKVAAFLQKPYTSRRLLELVSSVVR